MSQSGSGLEIECQWSLGGEETPMVLMGVQLVNRTSFLVCQPVINSVHLINSFLIQMHSDRGRVLKK